MPEREYPVKAIHRRRRAIERLAAANTLLNTHGSPHRRYDASSYATAVNAEPDTDTFQKDIWTAKLYESGVEIVSFPDNKPLVEKIFLGERRHTLVGIIVETDWIMGK